MPTFILASRLNAYDKDENGKRIPKKILDENSILTNLKKYLKKRDNCLIIANNPNNYLKTDSFLNIFKKSFKMSGIQFKNYQTLDSRNDEEAKELIEKADFIFLCGGAILFAKHFYHYIKLAELLKNYKGLIMGISAGAMYLTKKIFNFPESKIELENPKWSGGMGFVDIIFIPHFDGKKVEMQNELEVDAINKYILPQSYKSKMLGFPNGSYIVLKDGKMEYFGDVYEIKNGKVTLFNKKI